jgi:hypothetical protein
MATIYYTDGTIKEVTPANGTNFRLKEVQDIVGGYVEVVYLKGDNDIMIINEEGKLIGLERNEEATKRVGFLTAQERYKQKMILQAMGINIIDTTEGEEDYIAGTALVCKNDEFR